MALATFIDLPGVARFLRHLSAAHILEQRGVDKYAMSDFAKALRRDGADPICFLYSIRR